MKDYKLTFKRAFEQQLMFNKIGSITLHNARKFSTYAYAVGVFVLLWICFFNFFGFIDWRYRLSVDGFISYGIGLAFSDYKPDGKIFPVFLFDYFKTYVTYTSKKGYWYKGVYHKQEKEWEE